jgi:predicted GIY-YIG superfamily endonuclease
MKIQTQMLEKLQDTNAVSNGQSAAKRLSNGERSTTIPKGSTEVMLGKQQIYSKVRNVIYKITTKTNGKIYIGSASFYSKRVSTHLYWLRRNNHDNRYMQSAFNKYGEADFVFEIVENVSSKEELTNREQYWIDNSNCLDRKVGYNLCEKAESRLGQKMPESAKKAIGDFWRGKTHSKERVSNQIEMANKLYSKTVFSTDKFSKIENYNSISDASRKTGLSIACISRQCSELKQGRSLTFRYVTIEDKDIV